MDYNDIYSTIVIGMIGIIVEFTINITIFYIISSTIIKAVKRTSNRKYFKSNIIIGNNINSKKERYIDISKNELAIFNTDDFEAFKNYFYKIFLDFETAYNNLDYNTMKSLSSKQLFHNYHTGITLDLEAGKKRIINNIQKRKVIIYDVFSSSTKQVVSTMIEISYINYTMNKTGVVVSGSRDSKVTEKFEVIFRKDFAREEITNCPNCGASVTGNKCEFCRTSLKTVDFRINSIKKIID